MQQRAPGARYAEVALILLEGLQGLEILLIRRAERAYYPWSGRVFFSSRRRHTGVDCDWSSDVCSSDLGGAQSERQMSEGAQSKRQMSKGAQCERQMSGGAQSKRQMSRGAQSKRQMSEGAQSERQMSRSEESRGGKDRRSQRSPYQ